ncbi:MAG TPA: hypothetical protein VGP26_19495 [Actinophytocola sp.]|jgi:hypothetical protein|nr:hypothetical protein [Actinophytocola sp.]
MRILGLLAVVLLVTGCTVTRTGAGSAPEPTATPDPSSSSSSSSAPSTSPSAPGTFADAPADCADAECSIAIPGRVDIPLEHRFGFTDFVVTFVPPETMLFEGADPVYGDVHGNLSGTGHMTLNDILITVEGYGPDGARLTFTPPQ